MTKKQWLILSGTCTAALVLPAPRFRDAVLRNEAAQREINFQLEVFKAIANNASTFSVGNQSFQFRDGDNVCERYIYRIRDEAGNATNEMVIHSQPTMPAVKNDSDIPVISENMIQRPFSIIKTGCNLDLPKAR